MQQSMKTIDPRFEYVELLMEESPECLDPIRQKKAVSFPEGFHVVPESEVESFAAQWQELFVQAGFGSEELAINTWEKMNQEDHHFFVSHLYLLVDERNRLVSAAGLWPGNHIEEERIRIHYMMSHPDFQGRGLGSTLLRYAQQKFHEQYPDRKLYLSTQTGSWPAILMYKKAGFILIYKVPAK